MSTWLPWRPAGCPVAGTGRSVEYYARPELWLLPNHMSRLQTCRPGASANPAFHGRLATGLRQRRFVRPPEPVALGNKFVQRTVQSRALATVHNRPLHWLVRMATRHAAVASCPYVQVPPFSMKRMLLGVGWNWYPLGRAKTTPRVSASGLFATGCRPQRSGETMPYMAATSGMVRVVAKR